MTLRSTLLATTAAFALTGPASALPGYVNGWYMSLEGGAGVVDDISMLETRNAGADLFNATIEHDGGWAVMGTVGIAFNRWRFEGEASYRSNDIDLIRFTTGATTSDAGDFQEFTLMANMLYDFPLGTDFSFSLGAGVGFDDAQFNWPGFGSSGVDGDEWRFAYQGIAGLNYAITPQTELFVNYHYLMLNGPDYAAENSVFYFDTVSKHAATIGLRYRFGG